MQVADVCAGGGGKTLAMAAEMRNTGQLFAFDIDAERLAPIKTRLERAAARNVQVRWPARSRDALSDLYGRMDLVMVDAPCTGSGTWRRAPDAKWRLRPGALERRRADQQAALDLAAPLVKPGGRLVYVTCSVLPEENEDALDAFLRRTDGFSVAPIRAAAEAAFGASKALSVLAHAWSVGKGVQFTPLSSGCDGFFVSVLRRSA
jgi:16S rRNA (cytosine967-C5)-methyltransferase